MLLVKTPIPVPSDVFVLEGIVGLALVLQHTPRSVIDAPPSEVIFPPPEANVAAIFEIGDVERTGVVADSFLVHPHNNIKKNAVLKIV